LVVDYLIGGETNSYGVMPCPGLPRGRVSQVWGHESAGKTTLALTAAAEVCANGGTVVYIDWENDIVPDYAAALGVPITDKDLFSLVAPDTLEDGIKLASVAASVGIDLIIFDSVGAAAPARIANRDDAEVGEQSKVGELQAIWSQELPRLKARIAKSGSSILGISQIRAKISTGGGMGGPTTQPQGGNAWKFYSSVRLELRRIKMEKQNLHNVLTHKKAERVIGGVILCNVIKCKLSRSQGRKEVFYIRWGEGIDDLRTVLEIAVAHGVVKKGGGWYTLNPEEGEPVRINGVQAFREYIKEHPDDYNTLYQAVVPHLGGAQVEEDAFEDIDVDTVMASEAEEFEDDKDLSEAPAAPAE
jgi:recombination protein RecA